jgi:hypothetical protein
VDESLTRGDEDGMGVYDQLFLDWATKTNRELNFQMLCSGRREKSRVELSDGVVRAGKKNGVNNIFIERCVTFLEMSATSPDAYVWLTLSVEANEKVSIWSSWSGAAASANK